MRCLMFSNKHSLLSPQDPPPSNPSTILHAALRQELPLFYHPSLPGNHANSAFFTSLEAERGEEARV
jgi:hypothetical protein